MKKYGKLLIQAIIAGFTIGLGGTVFLRVKDAFPGSNMVGGVSYPLVEKLIKKL